MYLVKENISLKELNSFGVEAAARYFVEFADADDLRQFFASELSAQGWYVISGGNNILITGDYNGVILHPTVKDIQIVEQNAQFVKVRVGGALEWDDFVEWCVTHGYGGVENLSLIPGYVGASPVQNIGAYGVEVSDAIDSVEVFMTDSGRVEVLSNAECRFGYRESIFKHELKGRAIILSVSFRLSREPRFKLDYADIKAEVERLGGVTLRNIRSAIISIRECKLPDPKVLGNAGSFFKNPIVDKQLGDQLKQKHPDMPMYASACGGVKLASGWMIDRAGWKGVCRGRVGVHQKQALVLVNLGGATGAEVLALAEEIRRDVRQKFGVDIDMEVNKLDHKG